MAPHQQSWRSPSFPVFTGATSMPHGIPVPLTGPSPDTGATTSLHTCSTPKATPALLAGLIGASQEPNYYVLLQPAAGDVEMHRTPHGSWQLQHQLMSTP